MARLAIARQRRFLHYAGNPRRCGICQGGSRGLPLTPVQKTELYEAYSYVEAMAERVRAGGKRAPLAEPATIFKARG